MKGVKSMKKQYVKPELYFENFELSTSIAACAYTDATHQDGNTCAYSTTGGTILYNRHNKHRGIWDKNASDHTKHNNLRCTAKFS